MRTLYLWIALVVLVVGLCGVWALVGGGPGSASLAAAPGVHGAVAPDPAGVDVAPAARLSPVGASPTQREELAVTSAAAPTAPLARDAVEPAVVGRVVDADGAAVAGARVFASTGEAWYGLPLDVEVEGMPRRWRRAQVATTGGDGRFAFVDLEPGALSVVVRAEGFAPYRSAERVRGALARIHPPAADVGTGGAPAPGSVAGAPGSTIDVGELVLQPGLTVAGRVVDERGHGVAGAELVRVLDGSSGGPRLVGRGVPLGATADDGSFALDELEAGPWSLVVDAEGFVPALVQGRVPDRGPALEVRLERGAEIGGVVVGVPPDVATTLRVSARRLDGKGDDGDGRDELERARHASCAADGSFTIAGLEPLTQYRLTTWKPSAARATGGGWRREGAVRAARAASGTRDLELEYRPRAGLVATVVDADDGTPLDELDVWVGVGRLRPLRDEDGEPLREHEGGRVECDELGVQDGSPPAHLRIAAAGYEPYEETDIALAPGEVRDLGRIALHRSAALSVRVLDDAGEPVAGARVVVRDEPRGDLAAWAARVSDSGLASDPRVVHARTGAKGRARVSGASGATHYVVVTAEDCLPSDEHIVSMPVEDDHEHEVRLQRGGSVRLSVVDPSGSPIPRVRIRHRRPGESVDTRVGRWGGRARQRRTDEDGVVLVRGLEPGVHGFRLDDTQGRRVVADDGAGTGWLELLVRGGETGELEFVAPPRSRLSGVVRERGLPLEGASLSLSPEGERESGRAYRGPDDPLSTTTDHEGRYAFEDVRAGRYTLFATHAGRRMPERTEVELSGVDRELDLDLATTTIEGRVTDADGEPLAGIEIVVEAPSGAFKRFRPYRLVIAEDDRGALRARYDQDEPETVRTARDGRYALHGVAADEPLVVRAVGPFVLRRRSEPLTLTPGEVRRDVDFALRRAGRIALRLEGSPADGGRGWYGLRATRVTDGDRPAKAKGRGGKRGSSAVRTSSVSTWRRRRTLESLPPGRWRVELLPERGSGRSEPLATQVVEVAAEETARVVFRL